MTLYQKTILIIISTFIVLLSVLAVTSDFIIFSSFSKLEKNQITTHTRNVSNQIEDKFKQLVISAQEVAGQIEEEGFPVSGVLISERFMKSHSIDVAAVYDGAARLVAIRGFDCEKNESAAVPADHQQALALLVSQLALQKNPDVQGVVKLAASPFMVASRQIGSSGGKPGMVVTGWFIDNIELERIFRASGASITLYDLKSSLEPDASKAAAALGAGNSIYVADIDSVSVGAYFALKDIAGQSSYIVRTVEKRLLYEHGKVTVYYIFSALLLTGGVFCCVMLIFIRRAVLTRLKELDAKVASITELRDISARLPLSEHQDELKTLAVSINSMLESLEQAEEGMRESEERYRMLFERAPDAIIIIGMDGDEAGRIVAANQAAAEQHGYTVDELVKLRIFDLNTPETNKIAGDIFAKVAGGEWVTAELWHQKKDGSQFPIEIHAGLIKIGGRKYTLGFDRDITQRKITEETSSMHLQQISQLNDELNRKASELADTNSELETFNYSVSHDMRGPLTRISGYCQLLLDADSELDPASREYVSRIYESGVWLNDMVDALINLAQLTRVEIASGNVNLSDIAVDALRELSLVHPERTVRTQVEEDIVVAGDSRLLKMVMINLLNNAWKYSSGRSEALIEFGVDRSGSVPAYYVRDNGIGFDMRDAGKLFRVFSRLQNSSQFTGTGVGLATVQRIIFRHGGRIWAKSEPEVGTTFFFTLP